MSFERMILICNRNSGRGAVAKNLPEVESQLQARGLSYEIAHTEAPGHATVLATEALERGIKLVVAMGGDGTIHEVVNGMIRDDQAIDPESALGVIAAGTGSDFIKTFGLPAAAGPAVVHLDGPDSFAFDIGKITFQREGETVSRYFANVAEVGIGADVVARAKRLPGWFGPTVYFFAFWLVMRKFKGVNAKVDLVDRVYDGWMNNLIVANGQFFGGGMKIAPKAAPTDGVFDIQIEHARKREAIAIMPKIYKGEHVPHPDIEEAKRARVSVETDRPLLIEADGEVLGETPASFEILRDALRLKV